jgi:hypothetical protein
MTNGAAPPDLTPEQAEAMQLRAIFLPKVHGYVLDHFKDIPPGREPRFVHYTTGEAALNIIKTKRVWTRNTICMTDYREVHHGFAMFNSFFLNDQNKNDFIAAIDLCAPGSAVEAMTLFNTWLRDIELNTYVASLSEHDDKEDIHGRLSMWRAFGGSGAGRVAFVLNVPRFSGAAANMNIMFSPVTYWEESEVHKELRLVIENVRNNVEFLKSRGRQPVINYIFHMLVSGVTCSKHPGFREEREWRAIYSPNRSPSPLLESSTRVIGGVPQIVYEVPLDGTKSPALADLDLFGMLDRVILGPSPYPWVMHLAFVEALKAAGVADANNRVWASGIPIRA